MQWDVIWSRARTDLVITKARGDEDVLLWEHSMRVAQNARQIVGLPEAVATGADEAAVVVAALYHEAGWIARLKRGEIEPSDIFVRSTHDDHREEGAAMLGRSMAKLLPGESLTRALHAVRAMDDRNTDRGDALALMDADHLDEFGVISLWPTVRKGFLDGKGVQAAVETWRRRKEYRFWEARLRDSFHFDAVRDVARSRLAQLDEVMQVLAEQQEGKDLARQLRSDRANDTALG